MTRWDLGALARAAGSTTRGGALPESVEAVGTDSRSLPPASLFVALRGERFDGHEFCAAAATAGAHVVMVDEAGDARLAALPVPRLVVRDTLAALGDMARSARRALAKPAVAVTGSNGKTTTKEMVAAILGERGPVHKTTGNLNNLIGLPLTVFAWPESAWAAVLEMGMSVPGEIARLCDIGAPDVGIITMVGPAHLQGLGSIEAVARAKGELYAGLAAGATAVVNADDPVIGAVAVPLLGKKPRLSFGRAKGADVQVLAVESRALGLTLALSIAGARVEVELPLVGPHNAQNAAAAAAAAHALGMSTDEIARGLAKVRVPGGRLRVVRETCRQVAVIDDTYNANPASMRAAFEALRSVATGRRVAVLGDMLELGPDSPRLHREVGAAAAILGIGTLFAVGEQAEQVAAGAHERGAEARAFATMDALLGALPSALHGGDWVLGKGSRGMKMERVVELLTEST